MARKKGFSLNKQQLGIGLMIALVFLHVLPAIPGLGGLRWVGTLLTLLVAIYLLVA